MRHDHCLREAGFCGLIGVLDYGDAADRRAPFRSDLDTGHIGALNLEPRSVAVMIGGGACQKRRDVGKTQLVYSRSETADVEIALVIRLGRPAKSAQTHTLFGALDFDTYHAGARNRLASFVINDAAQRFISLLCDA